MPRVMIEFTTERGAKQFLEKAKTAGMRAELLP